jgi:hypothetical protein
MNTEAQTRVERAESAFAKKAVRAADASLAWKDHQAKEAHIDANMLRLRNARLEREAQLITPPPPKKKAAPKVQRPR